MAPSCLWKTHRCRYNFVSLSRPTDLVQVISLSNSKRWCMTSYRIFEKLEEMLPPTEQFDHGVRMRMANFFFDTKLEAMPDRGQLDKFEEIIKQPDVRDTYSSSSSSI